MSTIDTLNSQYERVKKNISVLETYDTADGKMTLKSSEELPPEEADLFDYYTNAFADGKAEVIHFQ